MYSGYRQLHWARGVVAESKHVKQANSTSGLRYLSQFMQVMSWERKSELLRDHLRWSVWGGGAGNPLGRSCSVQIRTSGRTSGIKTHADYRPQSNPLQTGRVDRSAAPAPRTSLSQDRAGESNLTTDNSTGRRVYRRTDLHYWGGGGTTRLSDTPRTSPAWPTVSPKTGHTLHTHYTVHFPLVE